MGTAGRTESGQVGVGLPHKCGAELSYGAEGGGRGGGGQGGGVAVVGPGPPQGTLCMKTSALSWQLLASSYAGSVTQRLRTWRRRSFRYPYHSL